MPDISVPLENKKDKIRIKKELTKKKGGNAMISQTVMSTYTMYKKHEVTKKSILIKSS